MNWRFIRLTIIVASLALAAFAQAGDKKRIYEWRDARGVYHATETPPPEGAMVIQDKTHDQPTKSEVRAWKDEMARIGAETRRREKARADEAQAARESYYGPSSKELETREERYRHYHDTARDKGDRLYWKEALERNERQQEEARAAGK